mgnify:CR=1 FL=1
MCTQVCTQRPITPRYWVHIIELFWVKNTVGDNRLSDAHIRAWIRAGERFEGRADGGGLYLRYRAADSVPVWRFRYRFGGVPRVVILGDYANLSLSDARREARRMAAQVVLGIDPAGEKKERKRRAPPPYITSSLQRDASSRLGLNGKQEGDGPTGCHPTCAAPATVSGRGRSPLG